MRPASRLLTEREWLAWAIRYQGHEDEDSWTEGAVYAAGGSGNYSLSALGRPARDVDRRWQSPIRGKRIGLSG